MLSLHKSGGRTDIHSYCLFSKLSWQSKTLELLVTYNSWRHFNCLICSGRLLRLRADISCLSHSWYSPSGPCNETHTVINHLSLSQHKLICVVYSIFVLLTAMLNHELGWEIWQGLLLDVNQLRKKLSNYWKTLCWLWEFKWVFLPLAYPRLSPCEPD